MRSARQTKTLVAATTLIGTMVLLAACSSGTAETSTSSASAVALDPATIGPKEIIGVGPDGDKAASIDDITLSDADIAKVKAGNFKVGLVMHTLNLDWSKLQIAGITDTFDKYGVKIIGTTDASYKVDKQVADIENMVQRKPDGIISIPVDNTATAPAYKTIQKAGIKLVLMDNVPTGLKHDTDYSSMISADSAGNGQIAAQILAARIPQGGTIGIIDFGVDFFVTNQRTKGVTDWLAKNRPDIKIKKTSFTDTTAVTQTAGDFLTANPDLQGLFAVWDQPAADTLTAMRAQGSSIPLTTIDLGLQAATDIASGSPLKGLGAQRPYDQGVAEATAMLNSLVGKEVPAWIGVNSLPVIQSNLLESYKTVWHTDPPAALAKACQDAAPACG